MSLILTRGSSSLLLWQRPMPLRSVARRRRLSSTSPAKKEPTESKPEVVIPTKDQLRVVALRYAIPVRDCFCYK